MRGSRGKGRPYVVLALTSAVLGVVVGVAWWLIAPTPRYVGVQGGFAFASNLPGEYIAADGWFAVLGAAAGVVVALVVLFFRELRTGLVVVAGVFGLLGSLLAWGIGHLLGPSKPNLSVQPVIGAAVDGPLSLQAKGVLLVWPVVTLAILTFVLAWQSPAKKEPEPEPVEANSPVGDSGSVEGRGDLGDLDRGQ